MRLRRRPSPPRAPRKRSRRIRKLRLAVLVLVLMGLAGASFTFGLVTAVASQIPQFDPERQVHLEANSYIVDGTGQKNLAVLRGSENRVVVGSDEIAPVMKHAIVAVEDRRFYAHRGVDLRAIGRAFWADVQNKQVVQGGSTITQQFLKNVYVKDQRSIGRKLKEAALAWQLEQQWSKDRILTAYLNTIYFGNGAYGIEQASRTYFDHRARRITLPEAALLAAIPADPGRYDPKTNPLAARSRRDLILGMTLEQGLVSGREYRAALEAPLPRPQDIHPPGTEGPAQYFVNYVKQQLVDRYGAGKVFGGGLHVRTTIDLGLQELGREAIAEHLTEEDGPEAALVAIDADGGNILAMIGGSNFRESQFNLAVQGERQAGSSFKPFVLAAALRDGIAPNNVFVSEQTEIPLGDRLWVVNNYEDSYLGPITVENATIHSDNAVYAQLTRLVGPGDVVRQAKRQGITSPLNSYFAIGLGAEAVNPLEMARAFATFATGGTRVDGSIFKNRPRAIVSIRDDEGTVENEVVEKRALGPNETAMVNQLLQQVVRQGTGKEAQLKDGRPVAGKTGTTENYGDAWFVGYTPQLVVAVWVGYPDGLRPMLTEYRGRPVAGGTFPALIWKSFMEKALPYLDAEPVPFDAPFPTAAYPRSIVFRDGQVQADNGYCRDTQQISFYGDAGPEKTADCKPNEVEVPRVVGMPLDEAKLRLESMPLTPVVVYRPAKPGERMNLVLGQIQADDRLSAFDEVTLVLAKPTHGVVPNVIGLELPRALARLKRAKLAPVPATGSGEVVEQSPKPGVAAAPGMSVRLVVARG